MFSNKNPEFRRPTVGPRRSGSPYRLAELFFALVAKATMAIGVLVVVILAILGLATGSVDGFTDIPTTRKGWRNLLLVILALAIVVALGVYFFVPKMHHPHP
ncbi:hypothetical protein PQR72_38330 [Paraburkholderia madseniana]|jgi:hypothetical protein|uniref:hypothetical protein n=1 Tax=Paraburkholderia madseniana TaxID=2599607 RepID=UPI0015C57DC6|nr:hypothetical protein [Paraburkholderia madseniana]NPT69943.1 hypothetical protein [Paraburkholderia madseniana]